MQGREETTGSRKRLAPPQYSSASPLCDGSGLGTMRTALGQSQERLDSKTAGATENRVKMTTASQLSWGLFEGSVHAGWVGSPYVGDLASW